MYTDFGALKQAIETTVKQTSYRSTLEVKFIPFPSRNDIIFRPANALSKLVFDTWVKTLLLIVLIYPFFWLFEQFHGRGGVWKVCGGGYLLKVVLPLPRDDGHQPPTFYEGGGSSSSAATPAEACMIGERGRIFQEVGKYNPVCRVV